jgi:hypothetical protein
LRHDKLDVRRDANPLADLAQLEIIRRQIALAIGVE